MEDPTVGWDVRLGISNSWPHDLRPCPACIQYRRQTTPRGRRTKTKLIYLIGILAGLAGTIIGLAIVIPEFGVFGVVWTGVMLVVALSHMFGLLRDRLK